MDRTGDIAELLVEHASDFRMCDLLEDNPQPQPISNASNTCSRKSGEVVGLVAGKFKFFLYINKNITFKKYFSRN